MGGGVCLSVRSVPQHNSRTERLRRSPNLARWKPITRVLSEPTEVKCQKCWPISRERKVLETPKLVGRLSTSRAIGLMRTSFKVKVTRPTNAETGSAQYLPNGKAYTNFKLGTQTSTKTRISNKRRDLQGQRSRSQGHVIV